MVALEGSSAGRSKVMTPRRLTRKAFTAWLKEHGALMQNGACVTHASASKAGSNPGEGDTSPGFLALATLRSVP